MPNITGSKILKEAMEWLDTPFQHQAMVKGVACDCAMLVAGIAYNTGAIDKKTLKRIPPYDRNAHLHNDNSQLVEVMKELGLKEKKRKVIKPTDILVFKMARTAGHLGIMINDTYYIHADGTKGIEKVTVRRLDDKMKKRIEHVFKFPGTDK